jgi:hypothetical protein
MRLTDEVAFCQIVFVEGGLWHGRWQVPGAIVTLYDDGDAFRAGQLIAARMAEPMTSQPASLRRPSGPKLSLPPDGTTL